jgi:hypothetical protein
MFGYASNCKAWFTGFPANPPGNSSWGLNLPGAGAVAIRLNIQAGTVLYLNTGECAEAVVIRLESIRPEQLLNPAKERRNWGYQAMDGLIPNAGQG